MLSNDACYGGLEACQRALSTRGSIYWSLHDGGQRGYLDQCLVVKMRKIFETFRRHKCIISLMYLWRKVVYYLIILEWPRSISKGE